MGTMLLISLWCGAGAALTVAYHKKAKEMNRVLNRPAEPGRAIAYTVLGPVSAILVPLRLKELKREAARLEARQQRLLNGPQSDDSLQACVELKQDIQRELKRVNAALARDSGLIGQVGDWVDGVLDESPDAKPADDAVVGKVADPDNFDRICGRWLELKTRREQLETALSVTEARINEGAGRMREVLGANEIDRGSVTALLEAAREASAVEPEDAGFGQASESGDVIEKVRVLSAQQIEHLTGLRVRLAPDCDFYGDPDDYGDGTVIGPGNKPGTVCVEFDYDDETIEDADVGIDGKPCDLVLADPLPKGQNLTDLVTLKLLGKPDRTVLQGLWRGATNKLTLQVANEDGEQSEIKVSKPLHIATALGRDNLDVMDQSLLSDWLDEQFGDHRLSLAVSRCGSGTQISALIDWRLKQAVAELDKPQQVAEPSAPAPTDSADPDKPR